MAVDRNGTWGTAIEIPGLADLNTSTNQASPASAILSGSISCLAWCSHYVIAIKADGEHARLDLITRAGSGEVICWPPFARCFLTVHLALQWPSAGGSLLSCSRGGGPGTTVTVLVLVRALIQPLAQV